MMNISSQVASLDAMLVVFHMRFLTIQIFQISPFELGLLVMHTKIECTKKFIPLGCMDTPKYTRTHQNLSGLEFVSELCRVVFVCPT